jgi:hypothetical protein
MTESRELGAGAAKVQYLKHTGVGILGDPDRAADSMAASQMLALARYLL